MLIYEIFIIFYNNYYFNSIILIIINLNLNIFSYIYFIENYFRYKNIILNIKK